MKKYTNQQIAIFLWLMDGKVFSPGYNKPSYPGHFRYQYNIDDSIDLHNFLIANSYLELASLELRLTKTLINDLKIILQDNNLETKGKKSDLITRILQNIEHSKIEIEEVYVLSEKGKEFLIKNKLYIWTHQNQRLINGLGFNLSNFCNNFKKSNYENLNDFIYNEILRDFPKKYKIEDFDSIDDALRYKNSYNHSIHELEQLKKTGIPKYEYLATLDKFTCKKCGVLDSKMINIKDAVIGINCPPLHKGCRCTIAAGFDRDKDATRSIRNPETNESEVVPYLSYNEFKEKYL